MKLEDENVEDLIQINVEGINALYTDDLIYYFKNLFELDGRLTAMTAAEREGVLKVAATDSHAFLYLTPHAAVIVPARAFTNEDAFEDFIDVARRYFRGKARPQLRRPKGRDVATSPAAYHHDVKGSSHSFYLYVLSIEIMPGG